MKYIKYIIFLAVLILLYFGLFYNEVNTPKRNKILFKSQHNDVEDSLIAMAQFLNSLPFELKINDYYYFLGNEERLFIDHINFGNIDTVKKYIDFRSKLFNDEADFKKFLYLFLYLKDNHIESAYKSTNSKSIIYNYRELSLGPCASSISDDRLLVFTNDIVDTNAFFTIYKLLDKKGNLVLVAPIEMRDRKDKDTLKLPY